jgi:hypothetical protein
METKRCSVRPSQAEESLALPHVDGGDAVFVPELDLVVCGGPEPSFLHFIESVVQDPN